MKHILSVFAGRQPNLEILYKYLQKTLESHIIDEVHLWDYTKNADDARYLKSISNSMRTSSSIESSEYIPVNIPIVENSFIFRVRASNDIHILLSDQIEIVLGGWQNTRSCVRNYRESRELFAIENYAVANPAEFIEIRVSIRNQFLSVYKNNIPFMIFELPFSTSIHSVAFKTGFGGVGIFDYEPTSHAGFFLMTPCEKNSWKNYYEHYTDTMYTNDIIIKCDDDIVFIDVDKLPGFIEFVKKTDYDLVFANIINNGVAAFFQQHHYGLFPRDQFDLEHPWQGWYGTLWESGQKATRVHEYFIENYTDFIHKDYSHRPIVDVTSRFSINFFGYKGNQWHKISDVWRNENGEVGDDEYNITVDKGLRNVFYADFYVAHLSFFKQIETGIDLNGLIQKYNSLFSTIYGE